MEHNYFKQGSTSPRHFLIAAAIMLLLMPGKALAVETKYYIYGDFNDWKIEADYELTESGQSFTFDGATLYGKNKDNPGEIELLIAADNDGDGAIQRSNPERDWWIKSEITYNKGVCNTSGIIMRSKYNKDDDGGTNAVFSGIKNDASIKYTITVRWLKKDSDGNEISDPAPNDVFVTLSSDESTTNKNFYLVGDLSCFMPGDNAIPDWPSREWGDGDQGAMNKVLRLNDEGDGFYSIEIPAVGITDGNKYKEQDYATDGNKSYKFVIAPENVFSGTESDDFSRDYYSGLTVDWTKCLRPRNTREMKNAHIDASDNTLITTHSTSTDSWIVNMNGGSYKFYINPTTGQWKATNQPDRRVMYVAVKEDGHWRAYQYLYNDATDGNFNGEHKGEFKTDGTGVLLIHNWKKYNTEGWFYTRNHLKLFADYDGANLYPINAPNAQKTEITGWDVAGTYGIVIDPSRGNAGDNNDEYDGQKANSSYGDLCGSLTREKIVEVEIVMPQLAGKIIRTYSNVINLAIPQYYKAYVAHDFKQGTKTGDGTGTVNLRRIKYIPANMGVVLVGDGTNVSGTVSFPKYTGTTYEDNDIQNIWTYKDDKYENETANDWNNFLVPVTTTPVTIENHERPEGTADDYRYYTARNFALNAYSHTKNGKNDGVSEGSEGDYIGFFRAKGTVGINKAYLRLPVEDGGFGYMNYNGQLLRDQADDTEAALAKTAVIFDDELDDFIDEETTEIDSMQAKGEERKMGGSIYDLQGRRIATLNANLSTFNLPKGIYIVNGKKVVVK